QDPYHEVNQAHGLCFSVLPGNPPPPSLVNIYKELGDDLGCYTPNNGYLKKWADQGVLLLNTVLTVREHAANSHQGHGWEQLTDAIIAAVNRIDRPVVFLLWGSPAQKKAAMLDNPRHLVLKAAHHSPLSAYRGFFGCRHFSRANDFLTSHGETAIDWQIENI
ncbi:MAG: uracil-DNA glycosylase, partial [Lachnospiraceae bacterium]|nr:uracil-DNA glycosylase [Lachnospiraceae bacterium]